MSLSLFSSEELSLPQKTRIAFNGSVVRIGCCAPLVQQARQADIMLEKIMNKTLPTATTRDSTLATAAI